MWHTLGQAARYDLQNHWGQLPHAGGSDRIHVPVGLTGQIIKPGPAVPKAAHSTISQSGSTFLQVFTICFTMSSNRASSASTVIFWAMKETEASATPS